MSFFDRFKKKAEDVAAGVWRQANPFDGGATYSNPRPQQQAPQRAPQQQAQGSAYIGARPQSQPVVNQSQMSRMLGNNRTNQLANNINTRIQAPKLQVNQPSYGNGLSGAFNQFKDKFDANTPQDQFKRQQAGQPQYARPVQQQVAQFAQNNVPKNPVDAFTNFNPILAQSKLASPFIAKGLNFAGNKLQTSTSNVPVVKSVTKNLVSPMVTSMGKTISHNPTVLQGKNPYTGNVKQQAGQFAEDMLNAASVVPIGAGVKATQAGLRGSKFLPQVAKSTGINAGFGAGYGASNAMKNDAGWKDVAKEAGIGGALGGAMGAGIPLLGKGASMARKPIGSALNNAGKNLSEALQPKGLNQGGYVQAGPTPKNIHFEDHGTMADTVDMVKGSYNPTPQEKYNLELAASRVGERYGITPIGNNKDPLVNLANAFQKRLDLDQANKVGMFAESGSPVSLNQQGSIPNPLQAFDKLKNKLNGSALDTTVKPATPENVYGVNALEKLGKKLKMNQGGFLRVPGKDTEMMVTHNLSSENLNKARELGGIPQASVGIVDPKKYAIDGYGEITLVGNNKLVDPKTRGTRSYASDIYSPRQPKADYKMPQGMSDSLVKERYKDYFARYGDQRVRYMGGDNIVGNLSSEPAVIANFLDTKGIKHNIKLNNKDALYELRNVLSKNDSLNNEFYESFVPKEAMAMGAKPKLYAGTSNTTGRQKWVDESMENALKIMRKERKTGAEGIFSNYIGGIRATNTKKFNSIQEIVDNKNRLKTTADFEKAKEAIGTHHESLIDELGKYSDSTESNTFTQYDRQATAISDYLKGEKDAFDYGFKNVPPSFIAKLDTFKKQLHDMPTEYFESVSDRAVKLNEFEKALIPDNLSKPQREAIVKSLNEQGIQPRFYKDGQRQQALIDLMEEDNLARQAQNPVGKSQGGYIKLPGKGAPIEKTITPENLTVVKEYSQMLKSMDDGARGGQMVGNYSDGYKRVTEHSKFYSDYFAKNKRAPSNKAYEEEALRQLKNGQADSYAQKTFDDLQDPEFRSLASEVEKGSLGKQPLGETFDIPQNPTVQAVEEAGVKLKTQIAPTIPKRRVVPQIPEAQMSPAMIPPDGTMTKTGGAMEPPKNNGLISAGPATKRKKTQFAGETIPNSEFVSDKIKGSIKAPEYNEMTERQGITSAMERLKNDGDEVFEKNVFDNLDKKNGTISRQDAIDAQSYAAILDGGDDAAVRKATQIYEKLSEHYTAAGQLTQAAAMMARRSPEGLRSYATKTLKNNGVKMTPQLEKKLVALVKRVREASPEAKPRAQWEVMDFVAKNVPTSTGDKVINTWRAGLLTAPTTTGGNLLGNSGEMAVRKGFVNPVATAADAVMGAFTGKRTMSLAKAGSGTKGFTEGGKMLPDYLKTGYDPRNNATKYDAPNRINTGSKALDTYINGTYRMMGVADMPFSLSAEKEALSSIARAEAINKGLKGKSRADFVQGFMDNPPETALARAQKEADYATFKNPTALGKAASGLKRPLGPVGDFIVPFTQVPASIATRIVERTPIGTATEMIRQIKNVKEGGAFDQRAMSQAIGNGAFGPAIMGIGYSLANSDMLTYGYPKDDKERKLWDSEGKQPYSVKVGDRWYSLNYLQPFGTLLAIGGQANKAKKEGKDISSIIGQGAATAGQSIMNQSFLKGVGGALDAISDPERSVRQYVENTTSSVVPNFVRSFARASDPKQRAPEGVVEGVKSGIPGLRETTTAKKDMFGQDLPAKDTFANQYLNPFKPSKVRGNEIIAEVRRLKDAGLGTVPTESNKNVFGKTPLTPKELNDLNATIGKKVGDSWTNLINSPNYKALPDEDKKKVLDTVKKDHAAIAKAEWAAKNNKISDEWQPKLTPKQKAIASGDSTASDKDIKEKVIKSKYSQEVQDFSKLSNAEKNAYFKRDPTKAKQLYDQAKQMDGELGKKTSTKTTKTTAKKSTGKKTAKKSTKGRKAPRGAMPKFATITKAKKLNLRVSKVKYAPVNKVSFKKKNTIKSVAKNKKIA